MKRISIFLLSLVFVFIPLNPAMAEQDYLDKRWAKTGCKPLNKQTKNALVPTDWEEQVRDNLGNPTGVENRQRLYFKKSDLQEYKWIMASNTDKKSKKERNKRISRVPPTGMDDLPSQLNSDPNNSLTTIFYGAFRGYKGACSQKGNKGMIFTVYLLKEYKDKKPVKWLQFESTGKGRDDSL